MAYYENGAPPTLRHLASRLDRHPTTIQFHCESLRKKNLLDEDQPWLIPIGPEARLARVIGEILACHAMSHTVEDIADSFGIERSLVSDLIGLSDRMLGASPASCHSTQCG